MGAISGQLLGLRVNGAFVSCEISCDFTFDQDMIPASAVDSERWKEFIAGIRSWSMSVNGNLLLEAVPTDFKAIFTSGFMNSLPLFVEFATRPSVSIQMVLSGVALVASGSLSGPQTGSASWNIKFQGTGQLQTTYNDFDLLIDAMPSIQDWQVIVDEST